MKKVKRKPRNTMSKKVDTLYPVDVTKLGTDDDPCFGKHFDPRTPECARCGDSEVCSIKMQQINHLKRGKIEAKQTFKDVEEMSIENKVDKVEIRKSVKNRIREMIKMSGKDGVSINAVMADVHASYFRYGYTKTRIEKLIRGLAEKSEKIILNKTTLKWKP